MIWPFCRHRAMYRERRPLHGVDVPHYVCGRCGYAVPVLKRETRAAHWDAWRAGQVRPLRAVLIQTPSAAERARVMETLTR